MNKTNNTNTINIVNKSNTNGNKTSSYNNGSNSGTGGSNNVPEKIKSFPIDKYTGPGVVGFLYNNSLPISDEAKNNNKLWGLQIDNKNDENIGINKIQKTSKTKNNIDEKSDKKKYKR